jgi:hypothetical protein
MTSLEEALNDFGLFGLSKYKPQVLMDNCVLVTFAYSKEPLLINFMPRLAKSCRWTIPNL